MFDKSKYLMFAVDSSGEVSLIRRDGSVEVLFPNGTIFAMSTLTDSSTQEPLSWVFHFTPDDAIMQGEELRLEYLDEVE